MGNPHPPPDERPSAGRATASPGAPTDTTSGDGTTSGDATTLEALATALDRLVLQQALTTEQARAVLRELALPVAPERPLTPGPPQIGPAIGSAIGPAPAAAAAAGVGVGVGVSGTTGVVVGGVATAGAAPAALDAGQRTPWGAVLGEVGGYVGAAFVLGGCLVLGGPGWDTLSRTDRVVLLAGPALALLLASWLVAVTAPGGWTVRPRAGLSARRRLVATMVTSAAALSVAAGAQVTQGRNEPLILTAVGTAVCAIGYACCRITLLHLALGIATALMLTAATNRYTGDGDRAPWGLVLAGVLWLGLGAAGVLAERTLGVVLAAAMAYVGGEALTLDGDRAVGYLIVGSVTVAGIAGYLWTRRIAVLVVGVVALATVVPQVVAHYSHGALRAGGALLVTGLSIVGASMIGLMLHRRPPAHRADQD